MGRYEILSKVVDGVSSGGFLSDAIDEGHAIDDLDDQLSPVQCSPLFLRGQRQRETHRESPRTPPATGRARSGIHAAYGAPRRHTMPSAPAVVKRGGGARRTSVSQSSKVTGHFFRLYLRPRCPGRGHNRRILSENGTPGRIRTCDPRLRRPTLSPPELRARAGFSSTSVRRTRA